MAQRLRVLRHTVLNAAQLPGTLSGARAFASLVFRQPARTAQAAATVAVQTSVLLKGSVRCMAGHSKWANIKHAKAAEDAKRSQIFLKLSRDIAVAVRTGGGSDPNENSKLASLMDKARVASMPKAKVMSAIKAGLSDGEKGNELVILEATGPDNIGIIVEVQTDNPKNCLPDIKKVMSKASLITGKPGCIAWMFDKRGVIGLPANLEDDPELLALEVGADEVRVDPADDNALQLLCSADEYPAVRAAVEERKIEATYMSVDYIPKSFTTVESWTLGNVKKAIETLEERPDISRVTVNIDPDLLDDPHQ